MPKDEHTYTVERNGSRLVDGWRLRQYRDGKQVKTGIFTPNGGWNTADELAKDAAHEVGQQWVEDNTLKSEIPW